MCLRESLYSQISDVSKTANGSRIRFDWRDYSVEILEMELAYWQRKAEGVVAAEAELDAWEEHYNAQRADMLAVGQSHFCDVADQLEGVT
tara:strand:+ start:839 stop:1108 length:270 start_codon:yes stop_codon:yes gene_type:complete